MHYHYVAFEVKVCIDYDHPKMNAAFGTLGAQAPVETYSVVNQFCI